MDTDTIDTSAHDYPFADTVTCQGCDLRLHFCAVCATDVDHGETTCSSCMRDLAAGYRW